MSRRGVLTRALVAVTVALGLGLAWQARRSREPTAATTVDRAATGDRAATAPPERIYPTPDPARTRDASGPQGAGAGDPLPDGAFVAPPAIAAMLGLAHAEVRRVLRPCHVTRRDAGANTTEQVRVRYTLLVERGTARFVDAQILAVDAAEAALPACVLAALGRARLAVTTSDASYPVEDTILLGELAQEP
ncbi:MAG: hypothetical protein HY906_22440 [Deltaproteobacteria bacterium]|nr:hypothetical protein [Deltaproteobacteria bacterium]